MKKLDFFLLGAILFLALIFSLKYFIAPQPQTPAALVYIDGEKALEIDLNKDGVYELMGAAFKFRLVCENGAIKMGETPCPNQTCVKTGPIKRVNSSIICVPNKVSIIIKAASPEVDTVAW